MGLEDIGGVVMGWARRQARFWQLTGLGILVSLAIVGPTFWWEETWHGAPLIDRGGFLWLFPSAVMALGFFLGGTAAGSASPKAESCPVARSRGKHSNDRSNLRP